MPFPADGSKLKLGKGSLLLDQLVNGVAQGFDFAGNCTAIAVSGEPTTVDKFSATQQSAPRIARAVTQVAFTATATLDEFNFAMLKKFLLAEEATKQQAADGAATLVIEGIKVGRYYSLDARQITGVSATRGTDPLTLGEDYEVNLEHGMFRAIAGGLVVDEDDVTVDWTQAEKSIEQLRIAKVASPICHLLYLSDDANQADPKNDRLEIWRVNVAPTGELGLIGDDFSSYQLTMAVLDDSANHPNDPFGVYERLAAS